MLPVASLGSSFKSFFDSADQFLSNLAAVDWGALLLALLAFTGYLVLRSRGIFNALRAAYPEEKIQWRRVWGAYVAAAGFKNVVPAGGANVIQLFLTKNSIEGATFPAVGSAIAVGAIFDAFVMVLVLVFAFSQGVFPKPPDFAKLNAFDLSFFASHFDFTLFLVTALGVIAIALFALLSARVKAFWLRVRQGFTILFDRRRYLRHVCSWQAGAWLSRFAAYGFMLQAFHIGASLRNILLVQGVQVVSTIVPLTPGGAGVQQALLVAVFSGAATTAQVAAYSVGQQIAFAAFALALGFGALLSIFKVRSFREVIRHGRAQRAAEAAGGSA
jgi:uncharacterized membrane protein YbhN (UPF0104 family)